MSLLKMENVYFGSEKFEVAKNISLSIEKGTVTEFHGPSGGGKSTLLKLLAGILIPIEGNVYYKDKKINQMSKQDDMEFRKKSAFVFQDCALWANQTILQNIILPLQIHFPKMKKEEQMEKVQKMCSDVKYKKSLNLRPSDLSSGEQKKVALARALICNPSVLFLDEVLASLDDTSANIFIKYLHEYISKGNTVVYISHNEKFRWEFPGDMYEIENGKAELQSIDIDDLR